MARTALSIAVPLDGTDRELGLKQLEQFASRKQTFRSQYKRFHGPFVEYITTEELRNGLRDWKELLHCSAKDMRLGLAVYTVPGSLLALSERLDENLARFLANYFYLLFAITLLMLGPVLGALIFLFLGSYRWMEKSVAMESDTRIKELKIFCLRYLYPIVTMLVCLVTSLGLRITSGLLLGMFVILLHASLHRAPSEFRYTRQNRVVRWIRRHRASTEGKDLLWDDVKRVLFEYFLDWRLSLQWKMLRIRDRIGLWRWTLSQKWKSRGHKDRVQLVKSSQ